MRQVRAQPGENPHPLDRTVGRHSDAAPGADPSAQSTQGCAPGGGHGAPGDTRAPSPLGRQGQDTPIQPGKINHLGTKSTPAARPGPPAALQHPVQQPRSWRQQKRRRQTPRGRLADRDGTPGAVTKTLGFGTKTLGLGSKPQGNAQLSKEPGLLFQHCKDNAAPPTPPCLPRSPSASGQPQLPRPRHVLCSVGREGRPQGGRVSPSRNSYCP